MNVSHQFVAREAKQCVWCGEVIPAGEKYHVHAGPWEDEWQTNRYHLECWTHASRNYQGWMPGDFKRGTNERKAK